MNKITDFKSHKNFNHGGPKFSLCLESSGLTCQIPNLYKTFCDGSTDPTKNSQLNIDIGHIKSYLIGTLASPDPYDVIINNYGSIVSSEFKKDFDKCENLIVHNNKTQEGFDIIIKTIEFMKQVCELTGYNDRDFGFGFFYFKLFLDPRTLDIKNMDDISSLSQDIKNKLRICCIIYVISNSKKILKSNGNLLNLSLYEAMMNFLILLEEIVNLLLDKLSVPADPLIREKLNQYNGYPMLVYLFFYNENDFEINGPRNAPNLLYNFEKNKILGEKVNNNGEDAFVTGFFYPEERYGIPLKWFTTCPKELLATTICHEIGHALKEIKPQPVSIQNYKSLVDDIALKWDNLNFQYYSESGQKMVQFNFNEAYMELFCDLFGVIWLENYLFETTHSQSLSDDNKYDVIKKSYAWNCEFPNSYISLAHPHHSFRVNLLLLSKKIHNFLCSYSNNNLIKFNPDANPACLNDADYNAHVSNPANSKSEYYSKYLKYKNKYLALKKQTNQ